MLWKTLVILSLSLITSGLQTPQLKMPGERKSDALPRELTENETQAILKERAPKRHVDATLKVSDARLNSALKFAAGSQYESAVEDANLYAALIVYADAYTRKLPEAQRKDRDNCLKKIEQAIFKQARPTETLLRELPFNYREPVETKIEQVKKIRLHALNDLLGGGQLLIKSSGE
jgi:hypothetical protein